MSFVKEDFTVSFSDGSYTLTSAQKTPSSVYWATAPNGFCDDEELGELKDSVTFKDPCPGRVPYFHIMTGDRYSVCSARFIRAGGMMNLRDIGGYNTEDGKSFIKHGKLYRSDMLALCGEKEHHRLESLGLRHVIDLRSESDAHRLDGAPRLDPPIYGAAHEYLPFTSVDNIIMTFDETLGESGERFEGYYLDMLESYKKMPFDRGTLGKIFRYLLDGEAPLLYHCYAGKDRTGIVTAVIMLALGVPRETIIYDYMLSREARRPHFLAMCERYKEQLVTDRLVDIMAFFTMVSEDAILLTLNAIDERYPDIKDYFNDALGLSEADIKTLRGMYLERH